MGKAETVSAQLTALQSAQQQALSDALGECYDQGAVDQKVSDGSFTQSDLDAAVAQVKADADQAMASAKAQSDAAMADLQKSLADMTAKEQLEEAVVADVKSKIDQVQASFDAIKNLFATPSAV